MTAGWSTDVSEAGNARALRVAVHREFTPATFREVVEAWRSDSAFRGWFNGVLAGVKFSAFRWETPPVTSANIDRPFEFVLLDSPGLAREPEPDAFKEHFGAGASRDVVSFSNLGRDAIMIVPRPIAASSAYGHLAAFVRQAPEPQRLALWQAVGDAMAGRLSAKPVWLSTAGAGVSWLHVRLDDRPKYYGFRPFREAP
jgi:hypothetical protein